MPTGKGLPDAVRRGHAIGCTAVQVFTSSPQQWAAKPIPDEAPSTLAQALSDTKIDRAALVSHDSYLINLAAPDLEKRKMSAQALAKELIRSHTYGIPNVVSHLGAHMGQGEEAGLHAVATELRAILADAPPHITLLAETTAGQGSSLDYKLEHLATLLDFLNSPPNFGVCLDTCHLFAAGYDLRTPETYTKTMQALDQTITAAKVKAVHVNDSKKPLGSRVDRHAHIAEGEIGETAFRCLVHDPRWTHTPLLLETPEAETHHAVNLAKLWRYTQEPSPL